MFFVVLLNWWQNKEPCLDLLDCLSSQKERSVFRRYIGVGKKILILKGE